MSIFTWSRKVRYSEASKNGTPSDIAYLPPTQVKNINRRASQKRKRPIKEIIRGPRIGNSRKNTLGKKKKKNSNSERSAVDDFAHAFGEEDTPGD